MVRTLYLAGIYTDKKIVDGILAREDSFPLLARIATSQEFWDDPHSEPWAPICAIHLLAKMKHYRAQLAVNTATMQHPDDSDDWLTEDAPYVMAHMGTGAIRTLAALMLYGGAGMYVRIGAAAALSMIARDHPETGPGIIASVKTAIQNEDDTPTRSMMASALLDLKNPDLYEYLRNLLESGLVSTDFFDMKFVDELYAGKHAPSRDRPRDPLYIFTYRGDDHYESRYAGGRAKLYVFRNAGRNRPCPCGSGKRYKKCCLLEIRGLRGRSRRDPFFEASGA